MSKLVYLNGLIIPENKVFISPFDAGFLYAQGLFETMRAYGEEVFKLDEHIDRLTKSAPIAKIKLTYSAKKLKKAVILTLKANKLSDATIRLNLWQGKNKVNLLVRVKRFNEYPQKIYTKGFKAIISKFIQNECSLLAGIKSSNYLLNYLARKEARDKRADEAILLNTKGYLAEGSRSNIFLVKNRSLFTPSLDSGCLRGITRQTVIEIAKKEKIAIYEKKILPKEILKADEAFLTSSLMELMPLVSVNNHRIADGKPGRLSLFLLEKYRDLTKCKR